MNVSAFIATGKRFGYRSAVIEAVHRIANKFVTLMIFRTMVMEPKRANPKFGRNDERFRFLQLTPDQVIALDEDPALDLPKFYVERSLGKGDVCGAVLDGEMLANSCWYSTKSTVLVEEFEFRFNEDWAYSYANYTPPKYRGRSISSIGAYASCRMFANQGKKGLISVVDWENFYSLVAARKAGYRIFGWVFIMKIFGRYVIAHSPRCRDYGLSIQPLGRQGSEECQENVLRDLL